MHFIFPGFLWALLSVLLPIVVHFLQLRRPQRVRFTNTGIIQHIEFKNGRRRLQDLLILALRVLAIVFIVLAFSQPFIKAQILGLGISTTTAPTVFVDGSSSMKVLASNGRSLTEKAIEAAKQLDKSYRAGTYLNPIQQKAYRSATNNSRSEVDLLQQTQQGWGDPVVRREWSDKKGSPLYIFSDFQRSEIPLTAFEQLPTTREVVLLPQIGQPVGNVYVDSIWLNDAFVRVRTNMSIHIRLKNGGATAVRDCAVKVLIGEQQVAAFRTSLLQAQTAETVVQVQAPDNQLTKGKIVLEDLPASFDNSYYFVLRPTPAVQVVEIGSMPLTQAAYQREPLFQYHYAKPEQVDFGQLQRANLVLIDEATTINVPLRASLLEVTKRGGSVVIIPPAGRATQETYGQLLRALSVGEVQWENPVAEPVKQELAMPDLRASFFREVFGAQARQALLPKASPVLRLNGNGTDILRLRDGRGFLTEFRVGAGKVYVFSTPFDQNYSDFTNHALFIPVLYRLAMLSYREDQTLAYRIGTKELVLQLPAMQPVGKKEMAYRLLHDSLTWVLAQRQLGQQVRLELPAELKEPGFYQVQREEQVVSTVAFNQAKRESELAAYSAAELRQLGGPDRPNVHVLDEGDPVRALAQYRARQVGQPLWRYCLLLALSCLLVEAILLRRGRRASKAVAVAN